MRDEVESSKLSKDRGSALVSVLMMSLVLFAFIIAVSILMNQRFHSVNLKQAQDRAKYAARAGITRSLQALTANVLWGAGFAKTPLTGDPELSYQVEVLNNFTGSLGDPGLYAPDGATWVPKGTVWIRSVGTMGNVSSGSVGLVGVLGQYRPVFDFSIFGDRSVTILGSSVVDTMIAGGKADVGSNALNGPAIVIGAASSVQGKALCAPTADPTSASVISVTGGSTVGGKEASNETKVILPFPNRTAPPVLSPASALTLPLNSGSPNSYNLMPGDYTNVTVDGSDLILSAPNGQQPGKYFIDGNLEVRNGGRIVLDHANPDYPVILYVRGNATFDHAIIGVDSGGALLTPKSLQIYFTETPPGDASTFLVNNGTTGSFVAAGDNVAMTINGSEFQGALIGRTVTLNNSRLHYDTSLRDIPLEGQGAVTLLLEDDVPPSVAQTIAGGGAAPPVLPGQPNPPQAPAVPGVPPAQPGVTAGATAPVVATLAAPAPPAAAPPATTPATAPAATAPAATTPAATAPAATTPAATTPAATTPAATTPAAAVPAATTPAAAVPAATSTASTPLAIVPVVACAPTLGVPGTVVMVPVVPATLLAAPAASPATAFIPATAFTGLPATPTSPGTPVAVPASLVPTG